MTDLFQSWFNINFFIPTSEYYRISYCAFTSVEFYTPCFCFICSSV